MTCPRSLALFAAPLLFAAGFGSAADLELEKVVEADIDTIYEIFTTPGGVETLFPGARAVIGEAVGEPYQVAFDPASPDGRENGTFGARILALERPHRVSFEWRGPVWASVMNTDPLPTRVEVSLTTVPTGTRVHLRHYGWGQGEEWEEAQAWFARAWSAPPPTEQPRLRNHIAFFGQLRDQGTLIMSGPFLDLDQDDDRIVAMGILEAADIEHAERLLAADPGIQAGLFVAEVRPWSTALPGSLPAPATDSAR